MSLPPSYVPATWRNVTPVDLKRGVMGLGFNLPDGSVMRFAVAAAEVAGWLESVQSYLAAAGIHSQSPMSLESPSEPKSVPEDGENV